MSDEEQIEQPAGPGDLLNQQSEENAPPLDAPWYQDIITDPDAIETVEKKGWKDVNSIVKSWKNSLTLNANKDADKMVELPTTADGINDLLAKAGRPTESKDYTFDSLGEGDPLANVLAEHAARNRISTEGAADLAASLAETLEAQRAQALEEQSIAQAEAQKRLEESWAGDLKEANMELAKTGMSLMAEKTGLTVEQVNEIGAGKNFDVVMKLMAEVGAAGKDHAFKGLDNSAKTHVMSVDTARAQLQAIPKDPENVRIMQSGNATEKAQLQARIKSLSDIVAGS